MDGITAEPHGFDILHHLEGVAHRLEGGTAGLVHKQGDGRLWPPAGCNLVVAPPLRRIRGTVNCSALPLMDGLDHDQRGACSLLGPVAQAPSTTSYVACIAELEMAWLG